MELPEYRAMAAQAYARHHPDRITVLNDLLAALLDRRFPGATGAVPEDMRPWRRSVGPPLHLADEALRLGDYSAATALRGPVTE